MYPSRKLMNRVTEASCKECPRQSRGQNGSIQRQNVQASSSKVDYRRAERFPIAHCLEILI